MDVSPQWPWFTNWAVKQHRPKPGSPEAAGDELRYVSFTPTCVSALTSDYFVQGLCGRWQASGRQLAGFGMLLRTQNRISTWEGN